MLLTQPTQTIMKTWYDTTADFVIDAKTSASSAPQEIIPQNIAKLQKKKRKGQAYNSAKSSKQSSHVDGGL